MLPEELMTIRVEQVLELNIDKMKMRISGLKIVTGKSSICKYLTMLFEQDVCCGNVIMYFKIKTVTFR
jgi:hypothetical protein